MKKSLVSLILGISFTVSALPNCSQEQNNLTKNKSCLETTEQEVVIKYCHSEINAKYVKDEIFIYNQENNLIKYYLDNGSAPLDGLVNLIRIYKSKGEIKTYQRKSNYYKHQQEFDEADKLLARLKKQSD